MTKKSWDSDWLNFSKKARKGIFVLIGLFILIAISPRIYYRFIQPPIQYDVKYIDLSKLKDKDEPALTKTNKYTVPDKPFDPNLYTVADWVNVGLSEKQAQSILKYIDKGGKMEIKKDLKKMFVVDDELYAALEDKIDLPVSKPKVLRKTIEKKGLKNTSKTTSTKESESEEETKTTITKPISINTATRNDLQQIKGVGPFFADEIVKLRERFGGIIAPSQFLEIYKMDEEKLNEILPYIHIDKKAVKKLNVNTASIEQLKQHPWITSDMANSIVYFRENYKKYATLDELLLSPYINAKTLRRLAPYLTIE